MVGSKQDIYDLCKIKGFSDTLRMFNQIYSYRMQINNLEAILMEFEVYEEDEEMINELKQEIRFYKNVLKSVKANYMKRIEKLIEENYDQTIIDKFIAICNENFYIEKKNIHAQDEDYIVNYEELKANNKVKIKELVEKAKKEM
jgi:hypothetical protein